MSDPNQTICQSIDRGNLFGAYCMLVVHMFSWYFLRTPWIMKFTILLDIFFSHNYYFLYSLFWLYLFLRKCVAFLLIAWINLNSLHPRMICASVGLNWLSGSAKWDENVKSLQIYGQMDNRQSGKLTLAFSKVELKSEKQQEHLGFRL